MKLRTGNQHKSVRGERARTIQIDEERPYSEVVVTMQVRILHDAITRSRLSVNIYPDLGLKSIAKKGLTEEQYGTNDKGAFVVNFNPFWLDLNNDYPRLDFKITNHAYAEDIKEMNQAIKKSVEWVLGLHRQAMQSSDGT
ncbi:MAG: hypothetical protein L0387_27350 [Acidobacteria bacterium]|nr:hypothetical protein [Acidobacteriota bacterium]